MKIYNLDGVPVSLPAKPVRHFLVDDIYVVLFDFFERLSTFDMRRNVMGFNKNGQRLWQIQPANYWQDSPNFYNGMCVEDGRVIVTVAQTDRVQFVLDPRTGSVTFEDGRPILIELDRLT